jgi:hypothetical protein
VLWLAIALRGLARGLGRGIRALALELRRTRGRSGAIVTRLRERAIAVVEVPRHATIKCLPLASDRTLATMQDLHSAADPAEAVDVAAIS